MWSHCPTSQLYISDEAILNEQPLLHVVLSEYLNHSTTLFDRIF